MVTSRPRARPLGDLEGGSRAAAFVLGEAGDVDAGLLGEGGVGVAAFVAVAGEVGTEVLHGGAALLSSSRRRIGYAKY